MLGLQNLGHMTTFTNDLSLVIKFFWWRHVRQTMTSQLLYENVFILRRPTEANFADIMKIPTIIKKTFKDLKKFKRIKNYLFNCNLYVYFLV